MSQKMFFTKLGENMTLIFTKSDNIRDMYTIAKYNVSYYLRFDSNMNFYIPAGRSEINILELITEIRSLIKYLDQNNIKWSGCRENIKISLGENITNPGILVITASHIVFISVDETAMVQRAEFVIKT